MASYFCLGRAEGPNEIDVLQFIRLIMLCICFICILEKANPKLILFLLTGVLMSTRYQ